MSKEAMKLALEALEENHHLIEEHERPDYLAHYDRVIGAIRKALAKQEQRNVTKNEHDVLMKALAKSGKVVDAGSLAKQEQGEPVAWMDRHFTCDLYKNKPELDVVPLYTTQQRKPLTDEQIFAIGKELGLKCRLGGNPNIDIEYARAIEAAHGIKE